LIERSPLLPQGNVHFVCGESVENLPQRPAIMPEDDQ
jgi:hypothetical protein